MTAAVKAASNIWSLAQSAAVAKEILLEVSGQKKATGWTRFVKEYWAAKAKLFEAIDKKTGRIVLPLEEEKPVASHAAATFFAALNGYGIGHKFAWLSHAEIAAGQLALVPIEKRIDTPETVGLKPGMKLGRVLTAYLTHYYRTIRLSNAAGGHWKDLLQKLAKNRQRKGLPAKLPSNEEIIAALVTDVMDGMNKPQSGHLVLSANILDLMLISESACFGSCQSFSGGNRSGALQYLFDGHTTVAYYYQQERNYRGHPLPYKLWRRLVHLDLKKKSAVFMREYPSDTNVPACLEEELNQAVASILSKAKKADWKEKNVDLGQRPVQQHSGNDDDGLAYIDNPSENGGHYVIVKGGKKPDLKLSKTIPCPFCKDGELADPSTFKCDLCNGGFRCPCCKEVCSEEDGEEVEGGTMVCGNCFDKSYRRCSDCDTAYLAKAMANSEGSAHVYCKKCAKTNLFPCPACKRTMSTAGQDKRPNGEVICYACFRKDYAYCDCCHKAKERSDLGSQFGYYRCLDCQKRLAKKLVPDCYLAPSHWTVQYTFTPPDPETY